MIIIIRFKIKERDIETHIIPRKRWKWIPETIRSNFDRYFEWLCISIMVSRWYKHEY